MSVPLLSPVDTPIYDDLIVEDMQERFGDVVSCEAPKGCDREAAARLVVVCPCQRWSRCGCDEHVTASVNYLSAGVARCGKCARPVTSFWVVPL